MKISVFTKAKPLPKSKDEKIKESKYASRPHLPEIREVNTTDELIDIVTNFVWSPSIFREARIQEDFLGADFLVLDVDRGLTIQEAESRIKEAGIACLCVPSTSHTPEAHRFRLIFPLVHTITNVDDYLASMEDLILNFTECDIQVAHNYVAFFFGSTLDDGFWLDGELLEPIKAVKKEKKGKYDVNSESSIKVDDDIKETIAQVYGEEREFIPECIDKFIKEAHTGMEGEWILSLNKFAYVLSLQGIGYQTIYDLVEYLAPNELDKRDKDCIKRAVKDGERDRDET